MHIRFPPPTPQKITIGTPKIKCKHRGVVFKRRARSFLGAWRLYACGLRCGVRVWGCRRAADWLRRLPHWAVSIWKFPEPRRRPFAPRFGKFFKLRVHSRLWKSTFSRFFRLSLDPKSSRIMFGFNFFGTDTRIFAKFVGTWWQFKKNWSKFLYWLSWGIHLFFLRSS